MLGSEKALINKICETMTLLEALLEFIDNAMDKKAKNIHVDYDKNRKYIKIHNDGEPFNDLEYYLQEFITHFKHEIGDIGTMNQGSKQAAACILDNHIGVLRIFSPVVDKDYCIYGEIRFNSLCNEESITSECKRIAYSDTDFEKYNGKYNIEKNGVTFVLESPKDEAFDSSSYLINECSKRYGKRYDKYGTEIFVNNKKVTYQDPLFLRVLGNDINNDGYYIKENIVFKVKTYKFKLNNKEMRQFKTVTTYLTRKKYSDVHQIPNFTDMMKHVGIYTFLGDRMMDCGGNLKDMFENFDSYLYNSGGTDRVRFGIFCDGNTDIFQISSNKARGIKRLWENKILREQCISIDKRNISVSVELNGNDKPKYRKVNDYHNIYDEIYFDFNMFEKMNRYEASIDGNINEITIDLLQNCIDKGVIPHKHTITESGVSLKKKDYIKNVEDVDCFLTKCLSFFDTEEAKYVFKSFYLSTRNKLSEIKTREIMLNVLEQLETVKYEKGNQVDRRNEVA